MMCENAFSCKGNYLKCSLSKARCDPITTYNPDYFLLYISKISFHNAN